MNLSHLMMLALLTVPIAAIALAIGYFATSASKPVRLVLWVLGVASAFAGLPTLFILALAAGFTTPPFTPLKPSPSHLKPFHRALAGLFDLLAYPGEAAESLDGFFESATPIDSPAATEAV